ncbi:MAG: hypothetical protein JRJ77_05315 [Deltaproteobacteria bacterium]|nr:hypothetical protein [Deltaproteobacteria bacterium]MBW2341439.1 hypothetical protein [Deltaproteobacteria bacterium]
MVSQDKNLTGQADLHGLQRIFFYKNSVSLISLYLNFSAFICVTLSAVWQAGLRLKYLPTAVVSIFALRLAASFEFLLASRPARACHTRQVYLAATLSNMRHNFSIS